MELLYIEAVSLCGIMLADERSESEIRKTVKKLLEFPKYHALDEDTLFARVNSQFNISQEHFTYLEGRDRRKPWLNAFVEENATQMNFWARYKMYLQQKKNFPEKIIDELDKETDFVLDHLFNPNLKATAIEGGKKGMVVGNVQSGKTSNYTGLICKAADLGFNFIIILAGTLNNLRSQTQLRLDEGFLGFDTQYQRTSEGTQNKIGVGVFSGFDSCVASSHTDSSNGGDFKAKAGINFDTNDVQILVIKKNKSILDRVNKWLSTHHGHDELIDSKSLLLIDDEADYASINTNDQESNPSTINRQIREVLSHFNRSGYVGYTATPFANIFIPVDKHDDLFPRDFILKLPTPSNYIGPDKIFGTTTDVEQSKKLLPVLRTVTDYEEQFPTCHKCNDELPEDLPQSMLLAIKCFVLTCAIRNARGQVTDHNSMLIHVSRYQRWQERVKELVEDAFTYLQRGILQNDAATLADLRNVFETDSDTYQSYKKTTLEVIDLINDPSSGFSNIDGTMLIKPIAWEEVLPSLKKAAAKIQVLSLNGSSKDVLEYYEHRDHGISVIAIGGDKLSRGLTLEGLSVSYFLRASKMYDTLMQMGRWFGYRPGYADLCRLFISPELNEWFRHISMANEELSGDFEDLAATGQTPDSYSLKVRTSPGNLKITSVSKMRNVSKINVSMAGKLIETYQLPLDRNLHALNVTLTQNLLNKLGDSCDDKLQMWKGVSSELICDYLSKYQTAQGMAGVNMLLIVKYIKKLNEAQELTDWTVYVSSINSGKRFSWDNGTKSVGCAVRNAVSDMPGAYFIRNNHVLGGASEEWVDLPESSIAEAYKLTELRWKERGKEGTPSNAQPSLVRTAYRDPKNPILIIYPLNPIGANNECTQESNRFSESDCPIMALCIGFPRTDYPEYAVVEYAIQDGLLSTFLETEDSFDKDNDNAYTE